MNGVLSVLGSLGGMRDVAFALMVFCGNWVHSQSKCRYSMGFCGF